MNTSEKSKKKQNSLAFDTDEMLAIVQSIKAYQNLCPTLSSAFVDAGNRALAKINHRVNKLVDTLYY